LERTPPRNLAGIVWFRLPTAADSRTWSLATWRAVVEGHAARGRALAELRASDTAGLLYIALSGSDGRDAVMPPQIRLSGGCIAADGANGYRARRTSDGWAFEHAPGGTLRGRREMIVGWARCATDGEVRIDARAS
jgi:hypothetical protein